MTARNFVIGANILLLLTTTAKRFFLSSFTSFCLTFAILLLAKSQQTSFACILVSFVVVFCRLKGNGTDRQNSTKLLLLCHCTIYFRLHNLHNVFYKIKIHQIHLHYAIQYNKSQFITLFDSTTVAMATGM